MPRMNQMHNDCRWLVILASASLCNSLAHGDRTLFLPDPPSSYRMPIATRQATEAQRRGRDAHLAAPIGCHQLRPRSQMLAAASTCVLPACMSAHRHDYQDPACLRCAPGRSLKLSPADPSTTADKNVQSRQALSANAGPVSYAAEKSHVLSLSRSYGACRP